MIAVCQRVRRARVLVDGDATGQIDLGLLVYLGVARGDTPADAAKLAEKVARVRIFDDPDGKLNLSVGDVGGGVLVVPNFTLLADTRKGRRPSFHLAETGQTARDLHETFLRHLRRHHQPVAGGVFGAHMHVESDADGPVNVLIHVPTE
jgi:D-tyrosyl-tRNA(Tyr) deacylase